MATEQLVSEGHKRGRLSVTSGHLKHTRIEKHIAHASQYRYTLLRHRLDEAEELTIVRRVLIIVRQESKNSEESNRKHEVAVTKFCMNFISFCTKEFQIQF
jgi:hypothetical protein